MNKLRELLEKRNKAVSDCRAIHEKAQKENRDLTAEEEKQYSEYWADAELNKRAYDREEALQSATVTERKELENKLENGPKSKDKTDPLDTDEYRAALDRYLRSGESGLNSEQRAGLMQGENPKGGYLVGPMTFVSKMLQEIDDQVKIRQWATTHRISGSLSLGMPSYDNDLNDAEWTTEFGTGTDDESMRFGMRELKPQPLAKRIKVSRELIRNSAVDIESWVRTRLAYKFGVTEEKHFLIGHGASQPLGVFTPNIYGITTARDKVCGTTDAVTPDGLIEVKFGLKEGYRTRATTKWFMHDQVMKNISKLKDADGQYIWRMSMREGEPDQILGIAVHTSEFAPNAQTTGNYVVILGDFSFYHIVDNLQLEIQRANEIYIETNKVGFFARAEVDGMPVLEEAFVRGKLA